MATGTVGKTPFDLTLFPQATNTYSGVDLNNFRNSGVYRFSGSLTHSPSGNFGKMVVLAGSTSDCRQIYFPDGVNELYTRRYYGNAWQHWFAYSGTDTGS